MISGKSLTIVILSLSSTSSMLSLDRISIIIMWRLIIRALPFAIIRGWSLIIVMRVLLRVTVRVTWSGNLVINN